MYTVHDPINGFYLHYNPYTKSYIVSDKDVGSLVFYTKSAAENFIREANIGNQFSVKELYIATDIALPRNIEKRVYDKMQH